MTARSEAFAGRILSRAAQAIASGFQEARMAGGISVHAVDVARGRPAQGMQVDIYALDGVRKLIANGKLAGSGALDHAVTQGDGVTNGPYEVIFHVGDYLRATGARPRSPPRPGAAPSSS